MPSTAELRDLSMRYAKAVDALDLEGYVGVFTTDATLRVRNPADGSRPDSVRRGRADIGTVIPAMRHYAKSTHIVGLSSYDVGSENDGDSATGEVWCVGHHYSSADAVSEDMIMTLRYADRYRRVDGHWLIEERIVHVESTEVRAVPQLSLILFNFAASAPADWDHLLQQARGADVAGVDRVVLTDHVAFGENLEAYSKPESGGVSGGKQPTGPDGHWLEPLTVLASIASTTSRVRLGTAVLQAALRTPAVLAKTLATLDVLSGGRVDLGVGVGWQREEYDATGLSFEGRGKLLDECLEVCQLLWTIERASFASERLTFDAIHAMPKPLQPGGVPIWVSGRLNPAVVHRLAAFGSGWIPWGDEAADLAAAIPRMRAAVAAQGRDPSGIGVVANARVVRDGAAINAEETVADVPAMIAAGATDVRLATLLPASAEATLELLAPIVGAFREACEGG